MQPSRNSPPTSSRSRAPLQLPYRPSGRTRRPSSIPPFWRVLAPRAKGTSASAQLQTEWLFFPPRRPPNPSPGPATISHRAGPAPLENCPEVDSRHVMGESVRNAQGLGAGRPARPHHLPRDGQVPKRNENTCTPGPRHPCSWQRMQGHPRRPPTEEQVNEVRRRGCRVEYCSATKRNEALASATLKTPQPVKSQRRWVPAMQNTQNRRIHTDRRRSVLPRGCGAPTHGYRVSSEMRRMFCNQWR